MVLDKRALHLREDESAATIAAAIMAHPDLASFATNERALRQLAGRVDRVAAADPGAVG